MQSNHTKSQLSYIDETTLQGLPVLQVQDTIVMEIVKNLTVLADHTILSSFSQWYQAAKPLRQQIKIKELEELAMRIKQQMNSQDVVFIQPRNKIAIKDVRGHQIHAKNIIEEVSIIFDALVVRLKRSIMNHIDIDNNTQYGFNLDHVRSVYLYFMSLVKWDFLDSPVFLISSDKKTVRSTFMNSIDAICSYEDIVVLHNATTVEQVIPIITKVLIVSFNSGFNACRQKLTIQDKKLISQNLIDYGVELYPKYPLAKKSRHAYSSVKTLEERIIEKFNDIIKTAVESIIKDASTQRHSNKSMFLWHIIFLCGYRFYATWIQWAMNYIIEYLKKDKEASMKEEHEKKQKETQANQTWEKDQKKGEESESQHNDGWSIYIRTNWGNNWENDRKIATIIKLPLQQPEFLKTAIAQLSLQNEEMEEEPFLYIERMVGKNKEIKLATWMMTKNIFVDTPETWYDFVELLDTLPQIKAIWIEDWVIPLLADWKEVWQSRKQKTNNGNWQTHTTVEQSQEDLYEDMDVVDLVTNLWIIIPDKKKFQDKIDSLPKDYLLSLKRVLHQAKSHPILVKDKKKYLVIKFKRKYRLVFDKKTKVLKDYGIYIIGVDYESLWAEMAENNQ
jgi:hypothetical protein